MKVVVIEDDGLTRNYYVTGLQQKGYDVDSPDGYQSCLRAINRRTGAIVCDTNLRNWREGLTGPDLIEELYQRDLLDPEIPIIPMSVNMFRPDSWNRISAAGGRYHFKESGINDLIRKLKQIEKR